MAPSPCIVWTSHKPGWQGAVPSINPSIPLMVRPHHSKWQGAGLTCLQRRAQHLAHGLAGGRRPSGRSLGPPTRPPQNSKGSCCTAGLACRRLARSQPSSHGQKGCSAVGPAAVAGCRGTVSVRPCASCMHTDGPAGSACWLPPGGCPEVGCCAQLPAPGWPEVLTVMRCHRAPPLEPMKAKRPRSAVALAHTAASAGPGWAAARGASGWTAQVSGALSSLTPRSLVHRGAWSHQQLAGHRAGAPRRRCRHNSAVHAATLLACKTRWPGLAQAFQSLEAAARL